MISEVSSDDQVLEGDDFAEGFWETFALLVGDWFGEFCSNLFAEKENGRADLVKGVGVADIHKQEQADGCGGQDLHCCLVATIRW